MEGKSGDEWISSVELENVLTAHARVLEAVVIGVPDERWLERPVAFVVARDEGDPPTAEELRSFLAERFARWWLPDRFELVAEIPKTGVGKFDKKLLRSSVSASATPDPHTPCPTPHDLGGGPRRGVR